MKRNVLAILFCLSAMFICNTKSNAQSILIHYWNFNTFTSTVTLPAIANLPADYTRISSPTATLIYQPQPGTSSSYSDYCDPVTPSSTSPDFDTVNARMGAPSGSAFRARNPNDSMEILLYIPSTHYYNLQVKYGCELSSYTSGDSVNVFAYSVDSGSTWITSGTGLSAWVDSGSIAFKLVSVHINDGLASNNRRLVFRITTLGRNHTTGGNNRFDNITVDGDTILTTTGINAVITEPVYTLYPNPATNHIDINASIDGNKSVAITNIVGQTVFASEEDNRHISVNTADLNPGVYCISIRENNTGNVSTMRFVKQ